MPEKDRLSSEFGKAVQPSRLNEELWGREIKLAISFAQCRKNLRFYAKLTGGASYVIMTQGCETATQKVDGGNGQWV